MSGCTRTQKPSSLYQCPARRARRAHAAASQLALSLCYFQILQFVLLLSLQLHDCLGCPSTEVYRHGFAHTPPVSLAPAQAATPSPLPTRPSLSTTHRSPSACLSALFPSAFFTCKDHLGPFSERLQPVVPPGSSPGIDASHHLSTHPVHLRSPAPGTGPSAPVVDSHCRIAPSPHRARTRPIVACALAIGTVNIQLQPAFRPISTTCSARLPVRHLPRASLSLSRSLSLSSLPQLHVLHARRTPHHRR